MYRILLIKILLTFSVLLTLPMGFSYAQNQESNKSKKHRYLNIEVQPSSRKELDADKPSRITMEDVRLMRAFAGLDPPDQQKIQSQALGTWQQRLMSAIHIRRFVRESIIFHAAIGLTMVRKAYTDHLVGGKRDPMWLENLGNQTMSPIGQFSFLCFLITSGQTNYWMSQSLKPQGRHLMRLKNRFEQNPNIKNRRAYKLSRALFQGSASMYSQIGLGAGIVASNIVSEIHLLLQNQAVHYCINQLLPDALVKKGHRLSSKNGELVCDDAYAEFTETIQGWKYNISAVILTAFVNHSLEKGLYVLGQKGTRVVSPIIKGIVLKSPAPIRRILLNGIWLIPLPMGGIVKGVTKFGTIVFRVYTLYSFMTIAEWMEYHLFHSRNEKRKAGNVLKSIEEFNQNFNPASLEKGLNCESSPDSQGHSHSDQETTRCSYHKSILAAHNVSNDFHRWREFQTELAVMAQNNWMVYVSKAIDSFETVYHIYRDFFLSQELVGHPLNQTNYLGPHFTHLAYMAVPKEKRKYQDIIFIVESIKQENEAPHPDAISIFKSMSQKITDYLKDTYPQENPTNPPLNLVSPLSESSFLKPKIQLEPAWSPPANHIYLASERDQLMALKKLFSVTSIHTSLKPFYDDWERELESAKEIVILETARYVKNLCDHSLAIIKEKENNPQNNQNSRQENAAPHPEEAQAAKDPSEEASEDDFFRNVVIPHCIGAKVKAGSYKPKNDKEPWKEILDWEEILTWPEAIAAVRKKYSQDNTDQWYIMAWEILRKRVMAAGVELLTNIVEIQIQRKKGQINIARRDTVLLQEKGYPLKLIRTLNRLDANHIFTQLFQELYRADSNGNYQYHIRPGQRGIHEIHFENVYGQITGRLHPPFFRRFHTPGVMDFAITSSLCGPDLREDPELPGLLQKIKKVLSKERKIVSDVLLNGQRTHYSFTLVGLSTHLLDEVFPGQDTDAIISQIPIFDRIFPATPYLLYPPRVLGLDLNKKDVQNLCGGHAKHNQYGMHEDIYNGSFQLENKTYNSLLRLALDHIPSRQLPTIREFDKWWEEQVEPYRDLFVRVADREYLQLVDIWFMKTLFRTETVKSVPGGVMNSISFEMEFWTDVIFQIADQSENRDKTGSLGGLLESFINLFYLPKEYFEEEPTHFKASMRRFFTLEPNQITTTSRRRYYNRMNEFYSEGDSLACLFEVKEDGSCDFLQEEEQEIPYRKPGRLKRALDILHEAASLLNVDIRISEDRRAAPHRVVENQMTIDDENIENQTTEEDIESQVTDKDKNADHEIQFTKAIDLQLGFFYNGETQSVNEQLLNYAFIRLKDLLVTYVGHFEMIDLISKYTTGYEGYEVKEEKERKDKKI